MEAIEQTQNVPFQRYKRRNSATEQMIFAMRTTPSTDDTDHSGGYGSFYSVKDAYTMNSDWPTSNAVGGYEHNEHLPNQHCDSDASEMIISMKMGGDGTFRPAEKMTSSKVSPSSEGKTSTVHNADTEKIQKETTSTKKKKTRRSSAVGISTKTIALLSKIKRRSSAHT